VGRCRRRGRGCRAVPAQMCSVSPHSSSTRAVPSFGQWLGACGVPAAQLPFARVTPPTVALHVVGARVSPAQVRKNTAGWGPQPLWKAKFSRPVSSGQAIPPRRPTLPGRRVRVLDHGPAAGHVQQPGMGRGAGRIELVAHHPAAHRAAEPLAGDQFVQRLHLDGHRHLVPERALALASDASIEALSDRP
jgi:hypothetical protein